MTNKLISIENCDAIDMDPDRMGGMPVLHNTRIPISLILSNLIDGVSIDEMAEDYYLPKQTILDGLAWLRDIVDTLRG